MIENSPRARSGSGFACAAAAVLALLGAASAQEKITVPPAARAALGLETQTVAAASAFEAVQAIALVTPPPDALHTSETPFGGVVLELLAAPGDRVTSGAPLARLRSPDFAAASADLASAALMRRHRAEIATRAGRLLDLGLRSEEEAEEAAHEADEARLRHVAAQEKLSLVTEGETPGTFTLLAAGDGIIADVHVRTGETVTAGDAVATVFAGEKLWARARVSNSGAGALMPGAPVKITGAERDGAITSVSPAIDPATRSVEVWFSLPSGGGWRLGQLLDVGFERATPKGALVLPARAVVRISGTDTVFVADGDGFLPVPVEVLSRSAGRLLVRGTLSAEDEVAVAGVAALKNIAGGA